MSAGDAVRRCFRLITIALTLALIPGASGSAAPGPDDPVYAQDSPETRRTKIDLMWTGARRRLPGGGEVDDPDLVPVRPTSRPARSSRPGGVGASLTPENVRINDPAGDAPGVGQAEQSIAMWGDFGLAAWNDGQGFIAGAHTQGVAYTTDGGATWVDVGSPPTAGATGGAIVSWTSDPTVAVNEATGEFYYCGLVDVSGYRNGIGVVRATFPGGVFAWDTPRVAFSVSNNTHFIDKQWLVADSTTANLYLTYTNFFLGGNFIEFRRSTTNGVTWDPPIVLNSPLANGLVHGSRPTTGPNGEIYVTWKEIGPSDLDFVRLRKSLNRGVSFDPVERTAAAYHPNFGTGAPGFNRWREVFTPTLAVDRSTGPYRGRLYVAWQESVNWFDDPLGGGGSRNEVERNDSFASATPFTPGQRLRGSLSSTADMDHFSFSAVAGKSYIFWCDSIPGPLYTMRIYCGRDTFTRLAYSGDPTAPAGGNGFIVWTAPASGTTYLRMAFVPGGGLGGYRIHTGLDGAHPNARARDQRDVFVASSDDGGASWSVPTRVTDDAGLHDNWLPEVAVTSEGYPYVVWYDWRDAADNCGGSSHLYVTRSTDGGVTWAPNRRVTSAPTAWSRTQSNIAPNQGDYNGLHGGGRLAMAWADGRSGDPDVMGAVLATGIDVGSRSDTAVTADAQIGVGVPVANANPLFSQEIDWTLSADRAWPGLPATGRLTVPEGSAAVVPLAVIVPDTAADGDVRLRFSARQRGGVASDSSTFRLAVLNARTAVDRTLSPTLALHGARPNPAALGFSVSFALSGSGPAALDLIDVGGRRVLHREVGHLGAGRHDLFLDREVVALPAGVYSLRLRESGHTRTAKVSIVR